MKTLTSSAALLAAALLAGCDPGGGTPAQPTPGMLTVNLKAAVEGDRALVISIAGPGAVGDVQPAAGYVAYARPQGGATRVAVFGVLAAGPVVRFSVPDTRQQYQATVVDAADGTNAARASMAGYTLEVAR